MERRSRDRYTHYDNEQPFNDIYAVLELLLSKQQGRSTTHSVLRRDPEVQRFWYREGSSGGDTGGVDYYDVEPAIGKQLIDGRLVEPRVEKYWGGRTVHESDLVISEAGRKKLTECIEQQREVARSLLVPGVHTKFSGVFNNAGWDWEALRSGRALLCFSFQTPIGERLQVWPALKRVQADPLPEVRKSAV